MTELVRRWFRDRGRTLRSARTVRSRIDLHIDDDPIGLLAATSLRASDVESWLDRRSTRGAARSGRQLRTTLGSAISWALRSDQMCSAHGNAALRARRPKLEQRSFGWLRADEVDRVVALVPRRWRIAVALAAYAGLRKGEVLGLRKRDVDLAGGVLLVCRSYDREATKNGLHRTVPIHGALQPLLSDECSRLRADDVLVESHSRRWGPVRARRRKGLDGSDGKLSAVLRGAIAEAGLEHRLPMRFHDLRHSFASILIGKGVPMKLVSVALGHSSVSTTEKIYAHLDPDGAVAQLKRFMG